MSDQQFLPFQNDETFPYRIQDEIIPNDFSDDLKDLGQRDKPLSPGVDTTFRDFLNRSNVFQESDEQHETEQDLPQDQPTSDRDRLLSSQENNADSSEQFEDEEEQVCVVSRMAPERQPEESDSVESLKISGAIQKISSSYFVPSAIVELSSLKAGCFVAGYVFDSSGSGTSFSTPSMGDSASTRIQSIRSPAKKRKVSGTFWHALFIADEKTIVKIWARAQPNAPPSRFATVKTLEKVKNGQFIALYIQTGPSISNHSYRKYELCTKVYEVSAIKLKVISPQPPPSLPDFKLSCPDAYNPTCWEDIDWIVHNRGHSFEVNCTFAVIGLNGRHTPRKARNGSWYFTGYLQDCRGVSRFLSVFAHIESFLRLIPEDVNVKHFVVKFERLRIRIMAQTGPSMPPIVASLTASTAFEVLQVTFEEFSNQAPEGEVDFADLEGFH